MVDDKYKELTDLFIANFKSFQSIEEPGGSDASNAIVAAGLAKSIIDALPSSRLNVVGEKTVAEINVYEKVEGDLFTVTDSGVLAGSEPLIVNRGWLVWWDGQKFVKVYEGGSSVTVDQALDITSANPIANAPVAAAIVDVNRRIDELEPGENVQSDWSEADTSSPAFIKNKPEIPAAITVDSALSDASTNPVQNKVVKAALDGKAPSVDGGYRTIDQDVSKGANLVVNGNGILGTNYNWPNFTFDATISKESPGAFKADAGSCATFTSSEYIKLDPTKRTYFECDVKRISPDWNGTFAMFPAFYDIDKRKMEARFYMWNPGSLATLTQDLKSGDTVVHLDSVANYNGSAYYQRGFIVWNYANSKGFTYPPETYSRNVYWGSSGLYENENIDATNNTITLNAPWTGPTIPAGTKLSRCNSGGTFKYLGAINISSDWQHSKGSLYGVDYSGGNVGAKFPPFTAFIKAGLILYSVSGVTTRQFAFTNYAVREEPSTADNLSGTLPIAHGGTGKTTANAAANALINGLPLWSADVTDNTQIIRQDNTGIAIFGRVPGSAMWNYIKSKVKTWLGIGTDNVLPITHGGTGATTASTARNNLDVYSKSEVSQSITNEATERQQADGELQAQIDAISSKSDVVDVVASYVELVAYDTSTLGDNDVIKVLEDETHDDAESYYRWNLTTETWGYIGSQGPFVTPAEMQTALGGKQNVNGTNATSAGMSTAINKLDVGSEDFLDSDYIICSGHNSGSTSTSEFVKRTFTKLYNRIKTKFDRVYASLQDISGKADNTPTFSQASTRANLAGSGETMPTILGKIKKWFADLNTVAFSGSYNDLSGKPTIPAAANDATLTVKMNGSTKGTFTANASADEEIDLGTVITDVSDKIEVAWKEFGRMGDMTVSERRAVYAEIANILHDSYNGGAKVLPCIQSGQGCRQFPYEGGYSGREYIYFAGIFGWADTDDLIIQTTSLYSDGRYEEYMHHIATTENFPTASTSTPLMDGVASAGTETEYARGNHRHPTDTSRQAALPTSGTASSTYAINISGNAYTANNASGKNFVVNGKGQETSVTVRYNDSTPPILLDATSSKRGVWASVSGSYAGKWVLEVDSTNEATLNASKIKCSSVSAVFGTEKNLDNMVCNEGEIVNVYEYGESASSGYSNRPVSSASSFRIEISSTRASSSIFNFKQIFFNGKDGRVFSRYTTGTTLSAAKSNWSAWAAGI